MSMIKIRQLTIMKILNLHKLFIEQLAGLFQYNVVIVVLILNLHNKRGKNLNKKLVFLHHHNHLLLHVAQDCLVITKFMLEIFNFKDI